MKGETLLRESKSRFSSLDRRLIRSKLAEASENRDIDFDWDNLTGKSNDSFVDQRYEWEISSTDDAYVVTEKQYVDRLWFYVFCCAVLFVGIGLSLAAYISLTDLAETVRRREPATLLIFSRSFSPFFLLGAAWFFGYILSIRFYYTGVLQSLRGASETYVSYSPYDVPFYITFIFLAIGIFGFFIEVAVMVAVSAFAAFILLIPLSRDISFFKGYAQRLRNTNPLFKLPIVSGEYFLIILVPIISLAAARIVFEWSSSTASVFPFGLAGFLVFSLVQVIWISWIVSDDNVLKIYFEVKQGVRSGNNIQNSLLAFCIVAISYVLFALLGMFLIQIVSILQDPTEAWLSALFLIVVSLPSFYFAVGMIYQTVHGVREKISLFRNSSQLDSEVESSLTVLKTESVLDSPASLSTGFNDYVFIPVEVEKKLGYEEIEAVVAHEEKHVRNREALLSFVMPVLSFLLLTGQNVLYALFDFRDREFEADKFAAEKVGSEAMISALEEMSQIYRDSQENSVSWWQDKFGMFYGTFTKSQVHPSVKERINRLDQE